MRQVGRVRKMTGQQQIPFEEYLLRWQMIDQDTRLQIFKKDKTSCEDIALNVCNPIL